MRRGERLFFDVCGRRGAAAVYNDRCVFTHTGFGYKISVYGRFVRK